MYVDRAIAGSIRNSRTRLVEQVMKKKGTLMEAETRPSERKVSE